MTGPPRTPGARVGGAKRRRPAWRPTGGLTPILEAIRNDTTNPSRHNQLTNAIATLADGEVATLLTKAHPMNTYTVSGDFGASVYVQCDQCHDDIAANPGTVDAILAAHHCTTRQRAYTDIDRLQGQSWRRRGSHQ